MPQGQKPAPWSPCSASRKATTVRSPSTAAAKTSTAKKGEKKKLKKKGTLNLGDFLNDMWHIYHEIKNQGNIWWWGRGGQWSSLLLNHPHDGVISALWMKDQYLISSPTTNNLASIHGHTKNDMRKKPCQTRILYPEKLCFRNEGEIKTFPEKLELREFLTTRTVS